MSRVATSVHDHPPATGAGPRWARLDHPRGAILFDPDLLPQPTPQALDVDRWPRLEQHVAGGRGAVTFVRGPFGEGVLRHYRRGGMMARVSRDRYLFCGAERTRSFREFRMLQRLRAMGLAVPRPIAAGYVVSGPFHGPFYCADLLSERIAPSRTLAQMLPEALGDTALWRRVGASIAALHAHGACHADLNAHNVLVDAAGMPWLIDFDRGSWCTPGGAWRHGNLDRLVRSLRKLGAMQYEHFAAAWEAFLAGYHTAGAAS